MDRWRGKVAVVTGASAGIGAAICARLVEEGCLVVGLARRDELVQKQAEDLNGKLGKLYAFKVDMTVEEDVLQAFRWTSENVVPVNILVNNAGLLTDSNLISGETAKWRAVLETNVLGLCIATREAIQIMMKNDINGHIVHINSITGQYPIYLPQTNVYAASKYAVSNLTDTLRKELLDEKVNVKITSISPGLVATTMIDKIGSSDSNTQAFIKAAPKLQCEDVADVVVYALSTPPRVQIKEVIIQVFGEEL